MIKLKTYLKYKFILQTNKVVYILFTLILACIFAFYTNYLIHKSIESELFPMIRVIILALIVSSIIYASIMTTNFIVSKEFKFLNQFSLSKIDKILIIAFNLVPYNLIFFFFYNIILLNLYNNLFSKSILIIISSVIITLVMIFSEILVTMLFRKINFIELRIIISIITFYCLARLYLGNFEYKYLFTKEGFLRIGNLQISVYLYNNFFCPSVSQIIKIIILLFLIVIFCYYITNFNKLVSYESVFNKVNFGVNKAVKKRCPSIGFLIKDILLLNRNYFYTIIELLAIIISTIGILQISEKNSIIIFIICSIYVWIFSFISSDLFKFEIDQIWLIKSLPISNKKFFSYKLLNSYINSVKGAIILLTISFLANRLTFSMFFVYLFVIQLASVVFCFICSSIVYVVFPKVSNGNVPVFIVTIGIMLFPPMIVLITIISLIVVSRKIKSSEVQYASIEKHKKTLFK